MQWFQIIIVGTLVVGVGACSGAHEPNHDRPAPAVAAPALKLPQLNVSALLPLSIDAISRQLGPGLPVPDNFVDPTRVPSIHSDERPDSTVLFQSRGLTMVVAYDARTRRVNEVLLMGSNENELMTRSGLQLNSPDYLVLPFFQRQQPTQLMGLRVLALALSQ
ncbi:MAG: hypothetical protein JWP58_2600 [Hymenobacter sp.]|nr:hypothetical protein [Hymenobacter sp.]